MPATTQRRGGVGRMAAASYFVCALYVHAIASLLSWAAMPVVAGLTPTLIVSESMAPRIHAGDLVLTRGTSATNLRKGEVVTFDDPAVAGRLLTHRVVKREQDGTYRTRGDANPAADATPVDPSRIKGVGRVVVPIIGLPLTWARTGSWVLLLLWGGITVMAAGYLSTYGAPRRLQGRWTADLGDAVVPPPAAPRHRRATHTARPVRRVRTAFASTLALLAVAGLASPDVAASDAAFTAHTANPANGVHAAASFCAGGVQTVTANADVRIVNGSSSNFGTETTLGVTNKGGSMARSLVGFSLPNIGACTATASLRLRVTSGSTGRMLHAFALDAPWSETAVLWSSQPGTVGAAAATSSATTGWIAFDVTQQVQAMYSGTAHGFVVLDAAENGAGGAATQTFSSREGSFAPELVLTLTGTTPPAAPTNLAAAVQSSTRIGLSWIDNATNESGYDVQRSPAGSGAWRTVASTAASATSFTDNELQPSTAYDYRVRASGPSGYSAWSATTTATTPAPPPPPSAPASLSATAAGVDRINLSWTDTSSNEDGFTVERAPAGTAMWGAAGSTGPNATTFADTGLAANTAYDYRVRAHNGGGVSGWAQASATTSSCATLPAQTLTSVADTLVLQGSTAEFGTSAANFGVRALLNGSGRSLVRFGALSPPGGCSVTSAMLRLHVGSATSPLTLRAVPVASAWTELGMTWTNQPATSGSGVSITSGTGAGWREWNVTSLVGPTGAAAANGFLIRDSLENQSTAVDHGMSPREGANPPQLVFRFD